MLSEPRRAHSEPNPPIVADPQTQNKPQNKCGGFILSFFSVIDNPFFRIFLVRWADFVLWKALLELISKRRKGQKSTSLLRLPFLYSKYLHTPLLQLLSIRHFQPRPDIFFRAKWGPQKKKRFVFSSDW
jgi:hypothetical protein